ncbi:Nif11-like leader peptide family natural product precursor, partial [Cyanobacteria bacterium 150SLHA]
PVAIAKAAGFSITTEDLNTQRQTLSDAELEGVAGGGAWILAINAIQPIP